MAQIRFTVNGDVQLSRNLRVLVSSLGNMKGFFGDALTIVGKKSDAMFDQRGANVEKNPKWASLADSTVKARQKRWGYYKRAPAYGATPSSTLQWTGRLRRDRTKTATDTKGSLTFNAPYAIYHQEGGTHLPKRAIIDLDNATNAEIVRTLQKKIHEDIGISGLQT